MLKSKCLIVIAFAFTVSHFDGCGASTLNLSIKGHFPTLIGCDAVKSTYDDDTKNIATTKCWKVPEVE